MRNIAVHTSMVHVPETWNAKYAEGQRQIMDLYAASVAGAGSSMVLYLSLALFLSYLFLPPLLLLLHHLFLPLLIPIPLPHIPPLHLLAPTWDDWQW